MTKKLLVEFKGGAGSGNWGHGGRPGMVGGSSKRGKPGAAVASVEAHPNKGEFGKQRYDMFGTVPGAYWTGPEGADSSTDMPGARVYYRYDPQGGSYNVLETKGHYGDRLTVMRGSDLKPVSRFDKVFKTPEEAQAYLKDRFGVDWNGQFRPEERPRAPSESPSQAMSRRQVAQAVARGNLTEAQARGKLGIKSLIVQVDK